MQASITRDPLQPAALRTRNSRSSTPAASRKRKRDDQDIPTFTAWSIDSTTKPSTVTFAPIVLIPRSNVPLVWLAPAASYKTLTPPYLFEAQVLPAWQHEGCALIARLSPNGGLYAIERASPSSWVACRLASWVTEQDCHDATDRRGQLLPQESVVRGQHRHTRSDSYSTTNSGRPLTPCSPKVPKNRRGAQVLMSLFSSRHSQDEVPNSQLQDSTNGSFSQNIATFSQNIATSSDETSKYSHDQLLKGNDLKIPDKGLNPPAAREAVHEEMANIVLPTTEPDAVQQSQQGPLTADQIIRQYLETLYLSRTSLAFYAKGPLSRARALAKSPEGGLSIEQLIDCLYSGIMPPKKADLKYREGLPTALKSLFSATEGEDSSSTKKKRATKKVKLGKDGLYNCEHAVMEKWWRGREIGVCSGTTSTDEALGIDIRQALLELRTRETQMQVLLILEVMALEAKAHSRAEIQQEMDEKVDQTQTSTPKAKRRPRNLQTQLDALIDKLCIWHTVSTDDLQLSTGKSDGVSGGPAKSKDELKEFYQEIIKPFYGSRLPQQTKLLTKKLVGADIRPERTRVSPQSHSHQKVPSEMKKSRPRQSAKRPLEHVFSDKETTRSESPPLLSRSSTLPSLKRERSMSALRRVPSDLAGGAESRPRMQRSVSFLGRQIDLVADAKAHQAKREKMDKINMQRSELKAVIEAVKKPDRSTVSKEIMDEVELHKKVQITATPSRRKAMQLVKSRANLMDMADDEEPATDSDRIVPSSMVKPSLVASIAPSPPKRRAALDAIADTPSKAISHTSIPPPTGSGDDIVAATPAKARLRPDLPSYLAATPVSKMNKSGRTVLFTPLKRNEVDVQDTFKDAPIIPEEAGKAMDRVMGGKGIDEGLSMHTGMSIYDHLGWDYDE
ncbi:hypothetical protein DV736_g4427, partial [Chaetothyriales sp. CBS 134916]